MQVTDTMTATGTMSKQPPPPSSDGAVSSTAARKQLPWIPDSQSQLSLTHRTDLQTSTSMGSTSYGPFFLEYSLLAEYNQLQKLKLPGVYVIPSAKSPLTWNGMLFIRQGLYQEGMFRFTLCIPDKYPDAGCPRLVFDFPVFHPIIDPETGELDVKRAFKKWRRNANYLWQVLLYARRVFYKIDTKSPLNPEAAVLYEQDIGLFNSRVAESVAECRKTLYDAPPSDDDHAIRFSRWDSDVHDDALDQMLHPKVNSTGGIAGS